MSALKEHKLFVFLLIVLLLSLGLAYVYVLQPLRDDNASLAAEAAAKERQAAALAKRAESRPADNPADLVRLSRARAQIPEQPYPELLLRDLRLMEVAGGVQMKYYNVQTGDKPLGTEGERKPGSPSVQASAAAAAVGLIAGQLYPVTVTTEFEGAYARIHRLLEEADTMNRIWTVRSMSLSPAGEVDDGAKSADSLLRCQISFTAYYAPSLREFFPSPLPIEYMPAVPGNAPF